MFATTLFPDQAGAEYSPCQQYRYQLWRQWDARKPVVTFVMLNPSTATELQNDPTVERCQRRAVNMGFGGLRVANLFALRSTDPQGLYQTDDPVGPDNNAAILLSVQDAAMVVVAWGTHGTFRNRCAHVIELLESRGVTLHCLGTNSDGTPKHPLYIGYDVSPHPYPRTEAKDGA